MLVSFFFWTLPALTPLSYKQTEWLGPDRYIKCMKYLGGALPATQLPDHFRPGKETKHIVNCVQWPCRAPSSLSALERKCMKHRPHFGQCTCRSPRNLSRVDLWSTCHLWQWQAHCAPSTLSNPTHISHRYLFSVWSSSHCTTEQVRSNKGLLLLVLWCKLVMCKHVTEENCKMRKWKNKEGWSSPEMTGDTN